MNPANFSYGQPPHVGGHPTVVFSDRSHLPLLYASHVTIHVDNVVGNVSQQVQYAMQPFCYDNRQAQELMVRLKTELPLLIGKQVDEKLAAQVGNLVNRVEDITSKQHAKLETQLQGTKDDLMAKKSSSIVTISGSVFGFGKITEAFSKAVDLVQGMRGAWRGLSNVGSNVDNVSFPRQLGRAALGGARGTLKIGAAGLGAAMVMSAVLATSGIALNKMHDAYPSVPSVGQVVSGVAQQAEKLKVAVGVFEVEKAGGPEAKTLAANERAAALLAQEGGDYNKALEKVHLALGQSYINDASVGTIAKQKELLTTLQGMQAKAQAPGAVVSASLSTAPAP